MSSNVPPKLAEALRRRQALKEGRAKGVTQRDTLKAATDLELVSLLYANAGSTLKVGKLLGVPQQSVSQRRARIEDELGITLPRGRPETWRAQAHRTVVNLGIDNGTILVGSDLHCWPDIYGVAMAAFVDFNRRLKPDFVILNGDAHDGATTSSHARLGWDKRPSVAEEIEALSDYLDQVRKANPNAKYLRTRGNHCVRLDRYLASNAPLVEGMKGTTLADHLPGWEECIAIWVNGRHACIKHRGRANGLHAVFNEVRRVSAHVVYGHLHSQKTIPYRNAAGQWYGVDLGMMAPMDHPGFDYTEADITDWRSGFYVLTFKDGQLLPPQEATVLDEDKGELYFAGQVFKYQL